VRAVRLGRRWTVEPGRGRAATAGVPGVNAAERPEDRTSTARLVRG
jgi:hypothetical protein